MVMQPPIRIVGEQQEYEEVEHKTSLLPLDEAVSYYETNGYDLYEYTPKKMYTKVEYVFLIILAALAFVPVLGVLISIWFVIKGFIILFSKIEYPHICASKIQTYEVKTRDRRYSSGYRIMPVEKLVVVHLPVTMKTKIISWVKKIIVSICHCIFPLIVFAIAGSAFFGVAYINNALTHPTDSTTVIENQVDSIDE